MALLTLHCDITEKPNRALRTCEDALRKAFRWKSVPKQTTIFKNESYKVDQYFIIYLLQSMHLFLFCVCFLELSSSRVYCELCTSEKDRILTTGGKKIKVKNKKDLINKRQNFLSISSNARSGR